MTVLLCRSSLNHLKLALSWSRLSLLSLRIHAVHLFLRLERPLLSRRRSWNLRHCLGWFAGAALVLFCCCQLVSARRPEHTQTPTGKALSLFRTQHNPGIMVSLAVSLETRILGPVFVETGIQVSGAYCWAMLRDQRMPKLHAFPRLLSSPQSLWLEDGAPSYTAKAVVTWQKKHFPLLVAKQAAASPDLSPLDFGIWALIEAKLRGNRASDMDTLKADISRAVTRLNSDAERPKAGSVIHNFLPLAPPRPSQREQPLRRLSVLTGHSILLTELPICGALESSRSSFDLRAQFVWRVG